MGKTIKTLLAATMMLAVASATVAQTNTTWTENNLTISVNNGVLTFSGSGFLFGGGEYYCGWVEEVENVWVDDWGEVWVEDTWIETEDGGYWEGHYENQVIGGHYEEQVVGGHFEEHVVGGHYEDQLVGGHYENLPIGGHYENQQDPYASWRQYRSEVTSIVIEEGVTGIGANAFNGFYELLQISIPNTVTSIGRYAFSGCSKLQSISIPASVTSIGATNPSNPNECDVDYGGAWGAFYGCSALNDIHFTANPDNLNWICDNEFTPTTLCHVPEQYLAAYQSKFANANVTFVAEAASPSIPSGYHKLKGIPAGWTVTADGAPVEVDAQGEAMIQLGAQVVVTPSDRDKPRVKSVSIQPSN